MGSSAIFAAQCREEFWSVVSCFPDCYINFALWIWVSALGDFWILINGPNPFKTSCFYVVFWLPNSSSTDKTSEIKQERDLVAWSKTNWYTWVRYRLRIIKQCINDKIEVIKSCQQERTRPDQWTCFPVSVRCRYQFHYQFRCSVPFHASHRWTRVILHCFCSH